MALLINSVTPQGFEAPQSYCRVELPQISLDKSKISFRLRRYKDGTGRWPAFNDDIYEAPYILSGANPFRQAYDFLKSLPEFSGVVDIGIDSEY